MNFYNFYFIPLKIKLIMFGFVFKLQSKLYSSIKKSTVVFLKQMLLSYSCYQSLKLFRKFFISGYKITSHNDMNVVEAGRLPRPR